MEDLSINNPYSHERKETEHYLMEKSISASFSASESVADYSRREMLAEESKGFELNDSEPDIHLQNLQIKELKHPQ